MTTKVLDNTFISASLGEMPSIDLIRTCSNCYALSTTMQVYEETRRGHSKEIIDDAYKYIKIELSEDPNYDDILSFLEDRFFYLHSGELSSFLLAVLRYAKKGENFYYVTDDGRMRRSVSKLLDEIIKLNAIDENVAEAFNLTGTIGLINRLCKKDLISRDGIEKIIKDLENSTFRITPDLIKGLRRCHEDKS